MSPGQNQGLSCKLCGNSVETLEQIKKPIYYHCLRCDLIFMDEYYFLSPAEEKARYQLHDNTCKNVGYVNMFEKFIAQAIPEQFEGKALDYGSGPVPVLGILMNKKGIRTDIYDPYFAPEPVFEGKRYDLITCTEVIEHISKPVTVLDFFCRHLNRGGRLAMMTLFHPPLKDFANWWYKNDLTHVCFYSEATFKWITENFPLKMLYNNHKNTLVMERVADISIT